MPFEVILHLITNLSLYIVSIHRNFIKVVNECAGKKKAKIPESRNQSFLVRYRRTYVLKKTRYFYNKHHLLLIIMLKQKTLINNLDNTTTFFYITLICLHLVLFLILLFNR